MYLTSVYILEIPRGVGRQYHPMSLGKKIERGEEKKSKM
jgi:hypothetical protein